MNIQNIQSNYGFSSPKAPAFRGGVMIDDRAYAELLEHSKDTIHGQDFQKAFSKLVDIVKNFTFNVKVDLLNHGVSVSKMLPEEKIEVIAVDTNNISEGINKACERLLDKNV